MRAMRTSLSSGTPSGGRFRGAGVSGGSITRTALAGLTVSRTAMQFRRGLSVNAFRSAVLQATRNGDDDSGVLHGRDAIAGSTAGANGNRFRNVLVSATGGRELGCSGEDICEWDFAD